MREIFFKRFIPIYTSERIGISSLLEFNFGTP